MTTAKQVVCEFPMPGGGLASIAATAYPNPQGLASPLKIDGALPKQALLDALHCARINEPDMDVAWRVVIKSPATIGASLPQSLPFTAIVADRLARQRIEAESPRVIVLGRSDDWLQGPVVPAEDHEQALQTLIDQADLGRADIFLPPPSDPHSESQYQRLREKHPEAILREVDCLANLHGRPCANSPRRRARVWYPVLHGEDGETDRLLDLEVILRPSQPPTHQDDPIQITGLPWHDATEFAKLLRDLRALEGRQGEWETLVRFAAGSQGRSSELALVLADRIARGREFPARGRLMATGMVDQRGDVQSVEGLERKCRLMLEHAQPGDRILMPEAWRQEATGYLKALREKGASGAFISSI